MCDETTETENAAYLEKKRLGRREVSLGAGAAVATLLTGCASASAPAREPESPPAPSPASPPTEPQLENAAPLATASRVVTIDTPDGAAEGFFVTPKTGKHPGVLIWPDVAGLRDAFQTMATRLASQGYAVLAVNQYYRSANLPILTTFAEWKTDEGKAKIAPMREALTPDGIASDGAAFAAWLDQQQAVDEARKLATTGYCMGGSFTFRTGFLPIWRTTRSPPWSIPPPGRFARH
jgi:carboxymethylenebutenolidase